LKEFDPGTARPLISTEGKPNTAADMPEATQSLHHCWENCRAAENTLADCSTVVIM